MHQLQHPDSMLKELIEYDQNTGVVTWKTRDVRWFKDEQQWCADSWNTRYAGKVVGTPIHKDSGKTYLQAVLFDSWVLVHNLISIYMLGEVVLLDHIDGDGTNNKWDNLRKVTHSGNSRNMRKSTRNTSGVVGVSWQSARGMWLASINTDKGRKFLGRFKNFDEAVTVRKAAEIEHNYHSNHGEDRAL